MTVGKDVSALFTDVLNCMQTNNLELKKLVYLYVMNYAKTQPDRAILAVNTFKKVCAPCCSRLRPDLSPCGAVSALLLAYFDFLLLLSAIIRCYVTLDRLNGKNQRKNSLFFAQIFCFGHCVP